MSVRKNISLILAPDEGDSISFRMSVWNFWTIVVGVLAGWFFFVSAIVFLLFGAKLFLDQRALVAENQQLRFALMKTDSLRIELEKMHSMRVFMEEALVVASRQNESKRFLTRDIRKGQYDKAHELRKFETGIPELDEYWGKIAESKRFMPDGLPIKGMVSATFGATSGVFEKPHSGLDIAVVDGTPVHATASGVVCAVAKDETYGNFVIIDHLNSYRTLYAHLQSATVNEGDVVDRGAVIGFSGRSGRCNGPHLHYEVSLGGKVVNPLELEKGGLQ